jgi:hypothetical protein
MLLSLGLSSSCKKSKGEYNEPERERVRERGVAAKAVFKQRLYIIGADVGVMKRSS